MKKISVIIPVYNVEEYLSRCLQSIALNTYDNLEIICINDGSKDKSYDILKRFAENDPRIVIINQENHGVSYSRNQGLKAATGDYIAFVDSDDWVHPRYFEILVDGIESNGADIAICGYKQACGTDGDYQDIDNYTFDPMKFGYIRPPHTLRSYIWGRIYKRYIFENRFFNQSVALMEDKDLAISILCDYPEIKIVTTNLELYFYFMRAGSASNVQRAKYLAALNYIFSRSNDYESKNCKAIYADEAFRYSLQIYDVESHQKDASNEIKKEARLLVKRSYKLLASLSMLPLSLRIRYFLFARIPLVYHIIYSLWNKFRQ